MNDKPTSPSDGGSPTGSDSSDSSASFPSSNTQGADGAQRDSRQGPQYGPQPGPAPSFQQYGGPQPGPQGGSTHRFFDSLRGSGLMRTNERWIAGVAGGVAHRFDLDPTLVRCVWVVLSLFAGVGLVLYGLAWALLPEESDGRIHLEEALSGRFNAGLAGAIGMTIIGMSTFGSGFIPNWYVHEAGTAGIAAALWPLFWLGLIILAIVFLIRSAQNRSANRKAARGPRGPQPWQTYPAGAAQAPGNRPGSQAGPAGPTGQAGGFTPAAGSASAWDSSTPGSGAPAFNQPAGGQSWQSRSYRQYPSYQQPPVPVRPARPRRPGPGSSLSLAVLGLGLLTAAGVWYATVTHHLGLLQGQFILIGTLVALLGAGIVASGLRRRHGGWMTVLGWPVLFVVAIPALATASIVPTSLARMPFESLRNATTATSSTVTWQELTASASSGSVTRNKDIGDLTLDLRGMPATEASKLSTITTHLDVGTLRIKTDTDQRVEVRADVDMGAIDSQVARAWTVNGRQMDQNDEGPRRHDVTGKSITTYASSSGGLNAKRTLTSPSSDDGRPQITINASVDTGTINIEERSNTVSWYGNAEEPVWIVSTWFDEKGDAHGDDLPVPGMNHQAITAKDAETCIRTAHESVDEDDRSEDVGWSNLSDLTSKERASYDSCVQRTLSGQGAGQPSASPSPSGSATPTPSPAPTKQSATASPTAG